MNKRLFVSNLAYSITEEGLEQLFARCGKVVSSKVVIDRGSGRSKGFGFVEMGTEPEAQEAIRMLNDQEILGRVIRVNFARPQEREEGGNGGGGFGRRPSGPSAGRPPSRRPFGGSGGGREMGGGYSGGRYSR